MGRQHLPLQVICLVTKPGVGKPPDSLCSGFPKQWANLLPCQLPCLGPRGEGLHS